MAGRKPALIVRALVVLAFIGIGITGCDAQAPVMTAAPIAPLSCALDEVVVETGQAALLRPVVSARTGPAAATAFAGPSVTDPAATILVLCTEAREGMDSNGAPDRPRSRR